MIDGIDITAIIVLTFNVFILCPLYIYGLIVYHVYAQKSHLYPIIQYRNSMLVYAINILIIFTNISERFFMTSSQIWNIIDVPIWSVGLFLAATWWAAMTLFMIKCYHLYYQQQYNLSIADQSWRENIDPNDTSWYISNRNTFGNPLYLIKIAFIPYLISVVLDVLVAVLMPQGILFDLVKFSLATIPIAVAMIVFYRSRKIDDTYNIKNEILYQFIILLTSLSIYTVSFVTAEYIVNTTSTVLRVEWLSYIFVTDGVSISLALFPTLYPIYLIRKNDRNTASLQSVSNVSMSNASSNAHLLLYVLSNYDTFKTFMSHLVSEFSAESLLFIVELVQIKYNHQQINRGVLRLLKDSHAVFGYGSIHVDDAKECQNESYDSEQIKTDNSLCQVVDFNIKPNEDMKDKDVIFTYLFEQNGSIITPIYLPSKLPKSVALTSEYNAHLYTQMRFLYDKYIKIGSDHEINISHSSRSALISYFEANSVDKDYKIFNIFDEVALENFFLLQITFV
eukprot:24719_1